MKAQRILAGDKSGVLCSIHSHFDEGMQDLMELEVGVCVLEIQFPDYLMISSIRL